MFQAWLRSVGIFSKSKLLQKWLHLPCFVMQSILDFSGISSLYQIWITFSYSFVMYHTIRNSYETIGMSTFFWHRAKVYFMCIKPLWWLITQHEEKIYWFISDMSLQAYRIYEIMHQDPIVVDCCTKYEQIQLILVRNINKYIKLMNNISHICYGTNYYFTCISNTWYLITVPYMNKFNTLFCDMSQQAHKMYENVAILTQICQRAIEVVSY